MDIRHLSPSVVLLALRRVGNIAKGDDVQTQVLLHTFFMIHVLKKHYMIHVVIMFYIFSSDLVFNFFLYFVMCRWLLTIRFFLAFYVFCKTNK
jgi:hypothetical protein